MKCSVCYTNSFFIAQDGQRNLFPKPSQRTEAHQGSLQNRFIQLCSCFKKLVPTKFNYTASCFTLYLSFAPTNRRWRLLWRRTLKSWSRWRRRLKRLKRKGTVLSYYVRVFKGKRRTVGRRRGRSLPPSHTWASHPGSETLAEPKWTIGVPHLFIPLNLSLTPPVPEYRYFNAGKYFVLFLKIIHIEFFRKLQIDIHTQ